MAAHLVCREVVRSTNRLDFTHCLGSRAVPVLPRA